MVSTRKRVYAEVDAPVVRSVFKAKRRGARSVSTQAGSGALRRYAGAPQSRQNALIRRWDNTPVFPTITGRGDYKTFFRNVGRGIQKAGKFLLPDGTFKTLTGGIGSALGGTAGFAAGTPLGIAGPGMVTGAMVGKHLGDKAGNSFAQMVGFGDYQVKMNSLMELPMGKQLASFGNMSNATVVRHREFVMNVVSPAPVGSATPFEVQRLALNPGLRSVFPWLSTVAGNYQEYQFLGCIFEYRSLSSDSAASLPLGSVTIASNYDTADPNYGDKREMLNSQFCVSNKPSEFMIHPIECDPKVTFVPIKYTRNGANAANTDSRLYDHCNVQVATEGLPSSAGQILGELWVSYEIALYKPQLGVTSCLRDHFFNDNADVGAILTASPLGANASTTSSPRGGTSNGLGITLTPTGIVFPAGTAPGRYEIWIDWRHTVAASMSGTVTFTPSTTEIAMSDYYDDAAVGTNKIVQLLAAIDQYGTYRLDAIACVSVANPTKRSCTITIGGFTCAPTAASVEVQVAVLPQLQQ